MYIALSPPSVPLRMRVGTVPNWQYQLQSMHLAVVSVAVAVGIHNVSTCTDSDGDRRRKAKESAGAQKVCRPNTLCMTHGPLKTKRSLEQLKFEQ